MRRAGVIAGIVLVLLLLISSCGSDGPSKTAVPVVTGLSLSDAENKLEEGGYEESRAVDLNGKRPITNKAEWVVFRQKPKAGEFAPRDTEILLGVIKKGEPAPGQATTTTTIAATTTTTEAPTTLPPVETTVETSPPVTAAVAPLVGSGGSGSVTYKNCAEAKAAGAAPLRRGDPGYSSRLDGDGDGDACE